MRALLGSALRRGLPMRVEQYVPLGECHPHERPWFDLDPARSWAGTVARPSGWTIDLYRSVDGRWILYCKRSGLQSGIDEEHHRRNAYRECTAQGAAIWSKENRPDDDMPESLCRGLGITAPTNSPPKPTDVGSQTPTAIPPKQETTSDQPDENAIADKLAAVGYTLEAAFVRHFKGRDT
jgi:hypothetical protein